MDAQQLATLETAGIVLSCLAPVATWFWTLGRPAARAIAQRYPATLLLKVVLLPRGQRQPAVGNEEVRLLAAFKAQFLIWLSSFLVMPLALAVYLIFFFDRFHGIG